MRNAVCKSIAIEADMFLVPSLLASMIRSELCVEMTKTVERGDFQELRESCRGVKALPLLHTPELSKTVSSATSCDTCRHAGSVCI